MRTSPGCLGLSLYDEEGPDPAVVLVERCDSEAANDAHLRSDACRNILAALESVAAGIALLVPALAVTQQAPAGAPRAQAS